MGGSGAGRAVPKSLHGSTAVWQTLAAGLALWLTLSPRCSREKKMASLCLRKPARFYGERALKVSLETLPPQPCEIHHLRKTHFIDEGVTSPAIWCLNPTAAHVEGGR